MEFGVEQNTVKYCRYYYGIIGKENYIQKIYSEEIDMYGIIGKKNHIFEGKKTENIQ